jgi:hypothetical protein
MAVNGAHRPINFAAARDVAGELQRGIVTTSNGPKHITNVSKRNVVEAFRQAGEIIEALLDEVERRG